MSRTTIATLVMICSSFLTAAAADQDLEKLLTAQYHDKVLALRHSFQSGSQEYAADGTPLNPGGEGAWTVYGRVQVKKITVSPARLAIDGKRALFAFNSAGLVEVPEDQKHPAESLHISVRLQQPLSSTEEAAAVLGRVFALTPEDILNSVPDYWQQALAPLLGLQSRKNAGAQDAGATQEAGNTAGETVFALNDILKDRQHFSMPKVLNQVEPDYSQAARTRQLQGTVRLNLVVDSMGRTRNLMIDRPLGLGLDDNAVATVRTWRFTPALHDGQPVAASLWIEVSFHLY